jgi:hypothetical protein
VSLQEEDMQKIGKLKIHYYVQHDEFISTSAIIRLAIDLLYKQELDVDHANTNDATASTN